MDTGALAISLAHTGTMPQRDAARGNTPMPSKRLPSLSADTAGPLAPPRPHAVHAVPLWGFPTDAGEAVTAFVRVQIRPAVGAGVIVHKLSSF